MGNGRKTLSRINGRVVIHQAEAVRKHQQAMSGSESIEVRCLLKTQKDSELQI